MNYAIVFRLLSYILLCESALLMLPAATSAIATASGLCWVLF